MATDFIVGKNKFFIHVDYNSETMVNDVALVHVCGANVESSIQLASASSQYSALESIGFFSKKIGVKKSKFKTSRK